MSDPRESDQEAERFVLAAMLKSGQAVQEAAEILGPDDFVSEPNQNIFGAIMALFSSSDPVTPPTVRAWLSRNKLPFDPEYIAGLFDQPAPGTQVIAHARLMWESAMRRRVDDAARQINWLSRQPDVSVADMITQAQAFLDNIASGAAIGKTGAVPLDDFLALVSKHSAPVIPGMIHHEDRVVVVGSEGDGKTVIAHQVGFGIAAGRHPFTGTRMPAGRTLVIDLENPLAMLQDRLRELRDVAQTVPGWDSSRLAMYARPGGIDLFTADDRFQLADAIRKFRPDAIVGGPIYKMFEESEHDGPRHAAIARFFDKMRERHGVTVWLETHSPISSAGGKRLMRPMGSGLWTRWPEFGISLHRKEGQKDLELKRFRGDRDETRVWPDKLVRNPAFRPRWPWIAVYPTGTLTEEFG